MINDANKALFSNFRIFSLCSSWLHPTNAKTDFKPDKSNQENWLNLTRKFELVVSTLL